MRIVIDASDDASDLKRARDYLAAMLEECTSANGREAGIETLGLSLRARHALAAASIVTVGDLCGYSEIGLSRFPGFGRQMLREVRAALDARGLTLRNGED